MEKPAENLAFVRMDEEAVLPPPIGSSDVIGWILRNFFASFGGMVLTVVALAFLIAVIPPIVRWTIIDAVWEGSGRDDCIAPGAGACWAFVKAKFGQFMYGRYTLAERWRVDLTAILLIVGLVPMAIPRVPYKRENAIYLLGIFPLIALILLTGGNFDISGRAFDTLFLIGCALTGIIAFVAAGRAAPIAAGRVAPAGIIVAAVVIAATLLFVPLDIEFSIFGTAVSASFLIVAAALLTAAIAGLYAIFDSAGRPGGGAVLAIWGGLAGLILLLVILATDFGLVHVETPLWGGLLVTLVVAIVGMVASMPLGIALALGRRSKLPIVRFVSIGFIEFVRGVPLITVLFMASVMLPLFLPPGVNFDKLLRALIGVALFSAAYMAEVIRGGLQAIPKGQYEAAQALGLSYSKSMGLIVLPQALKIVIPGIVNSFISLFKDTSLVLIIGIFDLLGIVQQNFTDANWASPNTPATGYVFAAAVFWVFCFGMSRYSIYTERRLDTGYRR